MMSNALNMHSEAWGPRKIRKNTDLSLVEMGKDFSLG